MTVGNLEKNIALNMLSYQQNKDEKRPQIRSKGEKDRQRGRKGERGRRRKHTVVTETQSGRHENITRNYDLVN